MERHTKWGGLKIPGRPFPYFSPIPDPTPPAKPAGDRPYFLIVARLEKIKGIQNVIPAFRKYTAADLVIAGAGDYEEELHRLSGGMNNIHFLGLQSQVALGGLYAGAVAAIVPSICYETFGIVIIEAFSRGTAVIAHDLGALPEVIQDSAGGLTYKTEAQLIEALRWMQEHPDERRAMGGRGCDYHHKVCSEEPHINRYLAMIEELQAGKRV